MKTIRGREMVAGLFALAIIWACGCSSPGGSTAGTGTGGGGTARGGGPGTGGTGSGAGGVTGSGGNGTGTGGTTGSGGSATGGVNGSGGSATGSGGASGATGTGGSSSCLAAGFDTSPTSWPLPTVAGGVFNWGLATYDMCPTYSTFDIDGDGKADLVIPDDCDASSTVGKDHWLVYRSTGSGFAASPINWSIPTFANGTLAWGTAASDVCASYATADMDGDGKPDLVVVDDCDTSTTVGKDHWLVYRNTGSGFAASPTSWALPTVAGGVFNWGLATYDMCPTYSTFDIDGDGKADLVVPDDCDASSTVGKDHWLVYRSTGSGFAASPINWSIPTFANGTLAWGTAASDVCASYATADMDGDGKPDLVVVDDCDTSTTVGKDHWLVYRNTGSGFAASPTSWPLPTVAGGVFNWGLATYDMCPTYSTFDIDGDRKADLVVPDDCDASSTVGKDHWLVYRSTGSGFAASPINWFIPSFANGTLAWGTAASDVCASYATADMDGDGKPDLVVVDDCDTSTTVGKDHWLVYLGRCQ
jgi:hypothetical protein